MRQRLWESRKNAKSHPHTEKLDADTPALPLIYYAI